MIPVLKRISLGTLLAASFAAADQVEYTAYYFSDNGNNTVATTAFSLAKTMFQRTMILLDVELDQTTVPPLDGVTGASRPRRQIASEFKKNRGQLIGGIEQGLGGNTRVAANYYFSHEVDYRSQSVIGSLTQELLQKNLTVMLKAQYTWDSVGEIDTLGVLRNKFKETHQASIAITQLLSPTTILRLGGDGMRQQGMLSDPYRYITLRRTADPTSATDVVPESHPAQRYRYGGWAELSQYLKGMDASTVVNYRYYTDDWGVKSHTLQLRLNKYITPNWILSPDYRFYKQTAADFGEYGAGVYHTGDYKLSAFTSHTLGAGLTCFLRAFVGRRSTLDFLTNTSLAFMYFHYFNDSGSYLSEDPLMSPGAMRGDFSADVLETRLKFAF